MSFFIGFPKQDKTIGATDIIGDPFEYLDASWNMNESADDPIIGHYGNSGRRFSWLSGEYHGHITENQHYCRGQGIGHRIAYRRNGATGDVLQAKEGWGAVAAACTRDDRIPGDGTS